MTSRWRKTGCLLALLALWTWAVAQPQRPVQAMWTLDAGHASSLDSYLSPITYGGVDLALGFEHLQDCGFDPRHWTRQLRVGLEYAYQENPVGNNEMHLGMADLSWALMRRWDGVFTPRLQLLLGGMTQLRGGALYAPAGSNNVVSAKVRWSVGVQGQAVARLHLGRVPLTLRYQASLPVAGVFFSPEYDESYYEIYLGNHRNLAHAGWWGNRFDMENYLTADFHLGGTIVRLGYRNRLERSWVSHLNTHLTTHALVIGIGGNFLTVK